MSRKQQSEILLQFVRFDHYLKHNDHHSPAAKGGDPKFSDIFFSLLIIYLWGLNKDI